MKGNFFGNLVAGVQKRIKVLFHNPYREVNLNWATLKYYKHLSAGKLRKHQLLGKPFFYSSPAELLHGFHEIFIDQIYKQEFTDHPYIIDCGANIGLSVIYLMHICPDATIIAFEPDESNFNLLEKNIKSFGFSNVILRNEAVWVEDTMTQFSNEGSMSSRIEAAPTSHSKMIKAIRLKNLLDRDIDFLKIDIEGAEYNVLKDCAEGLGFVKNLFVEYHGSFAQSAELSELFTLFSERGFSYYIMEATKIYTTPFDRVKNPVIQHDIQLNIFCFRKMHK
jgi:FkbM family methyltransferase